MRCRTACRYGGKNIAFHVNEGSTSFWLSLLVEFEDGDGDIGSMQLKQVRNNTSRVHHPDLSLFTYTSRRVQYKSSPSLRRRFFLSWVIRGGSWRFLFLGTGRCSGAALVRHVNGNHPLSFSHAARGTGRWFSGRMGQHGPQQLQASSVCSPLSCLLATFLPCFIDFVVRRPLPAE